MSTISYGIHAVEALLREKADSIECLYCQQGRQDKRLQPIFALAKQHKVMLRKVTKDELSSLTGVQKHQGIAAEIIRAPVAVTDLIQHEDDLLQAIESSDSGKLILILDGIQDPHNLGACLRSSNAAGVDAVIIPKDNAVSITPAVRKVACGAAEYVSVIQVTNISRTIKKLQEAGVWIYALDGQAEQSLYETDLRGSVALVMGAEGKGVRRLVKEACDFVISLPMLGQVESLNVSVATGICLYEALRQRRSQ